MLKIAIIIGSTRPGRVGEAVGKWVFEQAKQRTDAKFELIDIKSFNLPLLDEPVPPSMGNTQRNTRRCGQRKSIRSMATCLLLPNITTASAAP